MADLRELIKTWRGPTGAPAHVTGPEWNGFRDARTRCADELERALDAQPAPAGDVPMPKLGVADADGKPFAYWPHQLRTYGDARAAAAGAKVPDHVRRQVGRIDQWRLCMSHNESYFGEPAGLLKSVVTELAHAVDPIYPEPKANPEPLAGVVLHLSDGRTLAAAPQPAAVKESLTVAQCWCETCRPQTIADMRFIVCPDCGNKRCPKANDHRNACTNSNAAGQPGSSWEHVKPITPQPAAKAGEGDEAVCPHCERLTAIRNCQACGCDFTLPKPADGGAVVSEEEPSLLDLIAIRVEVMANKYDSEGLRAIAADARRLAIASRTAGSGEAVATVLKDSLEWTRGPIAFYRDHPPGTKLYAGAAPAVATNIVGWLYEDQLPEGYPYDAMFPHSKVDGVRMFPVFAPAVDAEALVIEPTQCGCHPETCCGGDYRLRIGSTEITTGTKQQLCEIAAALGRLSGAKEQDQKS